MTDRMTEHTTEHRTKRTTASRPERAPGVPAGRTAGLLALGVLGLAAAGLLAWRQMAADDAALLAVPTPAAAVAAPRAAAASAAPAGKAAPPAPALPKDDTLPLQAQIERLLATHDPEDAWRAYWLVANCAAFNANGDRIVFAPEELEHRKADTLPGFRAMTEDEKRHDARLCAGMTERERQNRLDYLTVAARAGVSGAAVEFASVGPFGDKSALTTRPDDPLVKEWKTTARALMSAAAESGTDFSALQFWASDNFNGSDYNDRNPALAYRYAVAWGLTQIDLFGPDNVISKMYTPGSDFMNGLGADLTPQQRADELAAAQAIAARARAARKAGRGG
jgi:hypothetical protein